MSFEYESLLHLPHPTSPKHPRMPIGDRAAQFAPFAALTGYDDVIVETARLTDDPTQLTEESLAILDSKLRALETIIETAPEITVRFFEADKRKQGGAYKTVTKGLRRVERTERCLLMTDGERIPLDCVSGLEHPMFLMFSED